MEHLTAQATIEGTPESLRPVYTVRLGDAFDLIAAISNGSVDLVITSPPYWGQRTYGLEHNWQILREWESKRRRTRHPTYSWYKNNGGVLGLEPLPDWYVSFLCEFFDLCAPKLVAGGSLWVNIGDTYFARWSSIRDDGRQGLSGKHRQRRRTPMRGYLQEKQLLLIPSRFAIEMQERRWILRNDLIWHKPNIPPRPEADRLRLSHEHFFHFVKRRSNGRPKYYYDLATAEARSLDVVTCNVRRGSNGHSATFPQEIVEARILSSSPKSGLILDPFCGTGTALKVAAMHGRRAIGFEISPSFVVGSSKT